MAESYFRFLGLPRGTEVAPKMKFKVKCYISILILEWEILKPRNNLIGNFTQETNKQTNKKSMIDHGGKLCFTIYLAVVLSCHN